MKTKKFIRCGVHLPVINLRQTLDYYRDVLGFYEEWTEGKIDGGIRRDEMRMLFGEDPDHAKRINTDSARLNLLWFVDNIEEVFAEFEEKGVAIASPLTTYPYGLQEFAFIDINGYYIRVAESIA
jgi:catechol 2,3-dioxygenase-like lactoylglutathione lyase family enzyme